MEFTEVIEKRYSCKDYTDKQVEKEKLIRILQAGRVAPTAKNLQEQKIYVIQSNEYLAKIDAVHHVVIMHQQFLWLLMIKIIYLLIQEKKEIQVSKMLQSLRHTFY